MGENILYSSTNEISDRIFTIRGKKVMLDKDLAFLYGVSTGNLNKTVSRNISRFPDDFMFKLNTEEYRNLIFQFGISSWGGTRKLPNAFTEQGIAMLSGLLKSERAIKVNIQIMRTFTQIRKLISENNALRSDIEELKIKVGSHDKTIDMIFTQLDKMLERHESAEERKLIGFNRKSTEK